MNLDHGILNVPLAKRGNIDAQIDAYKAAQAKAATIARREAAATDKAQKARIIEILAALPDERVLALAAPLGKRKPSTARAALLSVSWGKRAQFLAAIEKEIA